GKDWRAAARLQRRSSSASGTGMVGDGSGPISKAAAAAEADYLRETRFFSSAAGARDTSPAPPPPPPPSSPVPSLPPPSTLPLRSGLPPPLPFPVIKGGDD
ncbi:unnamed protein product, partial [Laminaria digitata]